MIRSAREFTRLYQDLLRVRFVTGGRDPATGLDCLGVVQVYLSRVRASVPAEAFPLDLPGSADGIMGWLEGEAAKWWEFVGDSPHSAILAGDVVLSMQGKTRSLPHVAVLCYPATPKLLLSASKHSGVFTLPLERAEQHGAILGVYRLRYEALPPARTRAA
ncbi:MAG TPA: hypothetical protein PKW35_00270 [Nannocystaceae bacterium]|nr:hypothetical protein [Nannocystaceae bacterium]